MTPIRTLTDAARVIGLLWQAVFTGDTIVRLRTLLPAVVQFLANGEVLVRDGGTAIGVPAGAIDRAPTYNVTLAAGWTITPAGSYTIASGYSVTVEAGAEMRIV